MSTQTGRAIGYSRGGQAAERGFRAVGRSENPGGAFEKNGGGGRRRSYPSCIPNSEDPDVLTLVKKPVEGPKTEGSSLFPQFLTPPPKKGVYY